jgi:hypothetical protein
MIFNSFQREDDDAVFTIVRNCSSAARSIGDNVVWDGGASVDGVRVTVNATNSIQLFRGVLTEALADSAYGKCQIHGYNAAAYITNTTNQSITAGDVLIGISAKDGLAYSAAGTGVTGFVYAAEAFVTSSTPAEVLKKVLIRAM